MVLLVVWLLFSLHCARFESAALFVRQTHRSSELLSRRDLEINPPPYLYCSTTTSTPIPPPYLSHQIPTFLLIYLQKTHRKKKNATPPLPPPLSARALLLPSIHTLALLRMYIADILGITGSSFEEAFGW